MEHRLTLPLSKEDALSINAGDTVYLSGEMYVARDAAHARLNEALDRGEPLPIALEGATIYYMGPSPARQGQVIGSAGPTTASRMDKYTPRLLHLGLRVMIGKGKRTDAVVSAMVENGAVYLAAVGGAGALLSKCIEASEVIAYDDLGPEAIRRITVRDFPTIAVIDARGRDLYKEVNDRIK